MPTCCEGYYQYPARAARQAARLTLYDGSLVLHLDEGDSVFTPPQLEVSQALDDIPLSITFPDGGRFMPADNHAFRQWYFQHRKPGLVYRLERRKRSIFAALVGTVLACVMFVMVLLPWLSGVIARQLPVSIEQQLGRYSALFLEHQGFESSSLPAARQAQLQALFKDALPADMRNQTGLRLRIMQFPGGANALMLPDGTLVLSDELVALAKSDDALASVMLHEIGHYRYRHSLQMMVRSSLIAFTMMWVIGDVNGIGDTLLQSVVFVNEMRFSRAMEREADAFAMEEMQRQGRALNAMAQIFSALSHEHRPTGDFTLPDWISTHPAMEERLERIEDAANHRR